MRPEDLVFWLDNRIAESNEHGVLCRRHADTMVVPRGWTLDDLRDPDLHLFRPPVDDSGMARQPRQRRSLPTGEHEQLALGVDVVAEGAARPAAVIADRAAEGDDEVEPWMPIFDTNDDLDGLLAAQSPLLSRAFRSERND